MQKLLLGFCMCGRTLLIVFSAGERLKIRKFINVYSFNALQFPGWFKISFIYKRLERKGRVWFEKISEFSKETFTSAIYTRISNFNIAVRNSYFNAKMQKYCLLNVIFALPNSARLQSTKIYKIANRFFFKWFQFLTRSRVQARCPFASIIHLIS